MRINHNINQELFEKIFKDQSVDGQAFLKASKTKGTNYDKFRDVGYAKTYQNPLFFKCITKAVTANSLIIRELGLLESGAIQVVVKNEDASMLKLSEKITIGDVNYTPWKEALGNRFQSYKLPFEYTKIILFRMIE